MKPHKHAELIKQWADGHEIEYLSVSADKWLPCQSPYWADDTEYRIRDPYRELKAAAADPTKQIRYNPPDSVGAEWRDAGHGWEWCFPSEEYEIRDKPVEKKKVKLLAWFSGELLIWRTEGGTTSPHWTRVPSEDKEIEV